MMIECFSHLVGAMIEKLRRIFVCVWMIEEESEIEKEKFLER